MPAPGPADAGAGRGGRRAAARRSRRRPPPRRSSSASAAYPPRLAAIPDPPPLLWINGDAASLAQPVIAIVGSRYATPSSLDVARALARDLAGFGFVIASGLARGVDEAAHRGALDAGATVGVLGCGLDRIYPPEHGPLAQVIAASGAIVSELPPSAEPKPEHFPRRNRIISGLALGVVVVEASLKSGSLITARCAADQGREVMAVPGTALGLRHKGESQPHPRRRGAGRDGRGRAGRTRPARLRD